ncbi:MAG: SRPBCC family protein [Ignavibacteriales bacterium]|nr:SRPBCC family protein [Ignavibacteriales bacterium]
MPKFYNTININASPDKAWTVVGDLAAVNRWVPMLSNAKVEGTERVCTLADGSGHMRESIRDYSNEKRSYAYTIIEGPLPAKNYRGSFAVMPHGKGSVVVWDTDFDLLDPAQEDEVTRMFEGIYAQCLDSLKQLIEKS